MIRFDIFIVIILCPIIYSLFIALLHRKNGFPVIGFVSLSSLAIYIIWLLSFLLFILLPKFLWGFESQTSEGMSLTTEADRGIVQTSLFYVGVLIKLLFFIIFPIKLKKHFH